MKFGLEGATAREGKCWEVRLEQVHEKGALARALKRGWRVVSCGAKEREFRKEGQCGRKARRIIQGHPGRALSLGGDMDWEIQQGQWGRRKAGVKTSK